MKQQKNKTTRSKQELIDAIEHISFEMNRYLYTKPHISLSGHYNEVVAESHLLHSRTVGDFFFLEAKNTKKDDIVISLYYDELISINELKNEIEKSQSLWKDYKRRTDKKLCHLTFERVNSNPMQKDEGDVIKFDKLIELFEKNLPTYFKENWNKGKSFSE